MIIIIIKKERQFKLDQSEQPGSECTYICKIRTREPIRSRPFKYYIVLTSYTLNKFKVLSYRYSTGQNTLSKTRTKIVLE